MGINLDALIRVLDRSSIKKTAYIVCPALLITEMALRLQS